MAPALVKLPKPPPCSAPVTPTTIAHLAARAAVLRPPAQALRRRVPPRGAVRRLAGPSPARPAEAAPSSIGTPVAAGLVWLAKQGQGTGVPAAVLPQPVQRPTEREAAARPLPGVAVLAHVPLREAKSRPAARRPDAADASSAGRLAPSRSSRHEPAKRPAPTLPGAAAEVVERRPRAAAGGLATGPSMPPKGVVLRLVLVIEPKSAKPASLVPALPVRASAVLAASAGQVRSQELGRSALTVQVGRLSALGPLLAAVVGPVPVVLRPPSGVELALLTVALPHRPFVADAGLHATGGRRVQLGLLAAPGRPSVRRTASPRPAEPAGVPAA